MALVRPLAEEESLRSLAEIGWGRLAVLGAEGSYAVPMLFALDGKSLLLYTRPGRKLERLREHPGGVVFEVDDIENVTAWRSVMVVGRFEEIETTPERRELLSAEFRRRSHCYASIALTDLSTEDVAIGRVVIEQLSGRAMQP